MKYIMIVTMMVMALFSVQASADISTDIAKAQISLFSTWVKGYTKDGFLPNADEILMERKRLNLSAEKAQSAYETVANNPRIYDEYKAKNDFIVLLLQTARNALAESKYKATRTIARIIIKSEEKFREAQKIRDVDACDKGYTVLENFIDPLADRVDTEKTVEEIRKKIPTDNDINSALLTYYKNEDNDINFQPRPFIDQLIKDKVNPYFAKFNASKRNSRESTQTQEDKKVLHDILD